MDGPGPIVKAQKYHGLKIKVGLAESILWFSFLLTLLLTDLGVGLGDLALALDSRPVFRVLSYFILTSVLFEIIGLPLTIVSGYFLEKKFGLHALSPGAWVKDLAKAWLAGLVLGAGAVEVFHLCLLRAGDWWWLAAGLVFFFFIVLPTRLAPALLSPLIFKFRPLPDGALAGRLKDLCKKAGVEIAGIYEWEFATKTKKAEASVVGRGASRRVVLPDSPRERFTPSELEVIVAHELGHLVHGHNRLLTVIQGSAAFLVFYAGSRLFDLLAPWFQVGSTRDLTSLPLLALIFSLLVLFFAPAVNGLSRRLERRADLFALELTGLVGSFISFRERLAAVNLAPLNPHPLVVFLLHSQPAPAARIAAAKDFLHRSKERASS
ncbi:MAG: M48 family metalloprotease [Pseudomonadota bacterium]